MNIVILAFCDRLLFILHNYKQTKQRPNKQQCNRKKSQNDIVFSQSNGIQWQHHKLLRSVMSIFSRIWFWCHQKINIEITYNRNVRTTCWCQTLEAKSERDAESPELILLSPPSSLSSPWTMTIYNHMSSHCCDRSLSRISERGRRWPECVSAQQYKRENPWFSVNDL